MWRSPTTNLTDALIEEGFVRELISKIQTIRKEAGFEVTDRIHVFHDADEYIRDIFSRYGDMIASATLATDLLEGTGEGYSKEWSINGRRVVLGVEKK